MSADQKPEIKVPPAQIWREFRMRFMPVGVFLCALVATYYLWDKAVLGPTMIGEVEAIQSMVISPDSGYVTNLLVRRFQVVKAGDPVAEIISTDPRAIAGQVQELRSQIAMSQLEISSVMDRERMSFDFQALNMNTLRFRADLAAARAEIPTLEAAAERAQRGWDEKVIPYNDYADALRARDSLRARIAELERLVGESEASLRIAAATAGVLTNFTSDASTTDAIRRLVEERKGMGAIRGAPITLRAPIDGTIGLIMRQPGENVLAGDIILTVHALESDRIVTYIRQGSMLEPKKGMPIHVRCRSIRREEAIAKIEEVGQRYEMITNQMLLRPGFLYEVGLPVAIGVPSSLRQTLKPGEIVDLGLSH